MNTEATPCTARPLDIAAALRAYQQGETDGVTETVLVSRQACDEGAEWLERLHRESETRYYEFERARAMVDNTVRLLTGIHSLLYPPRTTGADGRTWEFRFPGDPNMVLQELSDRIRALPDELAELQGVTDATATA